MITLHHCPETRSMRTLWLLNELGQPFQVRTYPFDKTLRSPEYLTLSPAGRVPALQIGAEVLFESGAMTEYLCERFSPRGLGRTIEDPDRADWLVWVHFAETISQHTAALTQQHIALYDDTMRSPIIMQLEARRLAKCLGAVDASLADPARETLLVSGFSAADISVGQAVYMAKHFVRLEPFEALSEWYEAITDRPAFAQSLPGEERLYTRDFYPPWEV